MDAKQCPWCARWCLKDSNCAYIFSCGLTDKGVFRVGEGCGRSWCWTCGLKYCGRYHDEVTGKKLASAKDVHGACCEASEDFCAASFCAGGHSSHCAPRSMSSQLHTSCTPTACVGVRG